MEISRVGIGKISVPELGTNSAIGWISRSGIGSFHVQNPHPHPRGIDCFLCSEIGWISIPKLTRGRVCFLGSVWSQDQGVLSLAGPFDPTPDARQAFYH